MISTVLETSLTLPSVVTGDGAIQIATTMKILEWSAIVSKTDFGTKDNGLHIHTLCSKFTLTRVVKNYID